MTMALDPNSKGIWESAVMFDETFKTTLESLSIELDNIINERFHGSIVELFEKVAMK